MSPLAVAPMVPKSPKFKNGSGRTYLLGLFYETTDADHATAVYTLKDDIHRVGDTTYPSLYRLYMETGDPTEYNFASQYLANWAHWEELCQCTWFQPYVERWRRELEVSIRSTALLNIRTISNDPKSQANFQANKYLLEAGWKPTGERKAGRPTKAAIQKETHRLASEAQQIAEDFERLQPSLN